MRIGCVVDRPLRSEVEIPGPAGCRFMRNNRAYSEINISRTASRETQIIGLARKIIGKTLFNVPSSSLAHTTHMHCQQKWQLHRIIYTWIQHHSSFAFRQGMRNGPTLNWPQS